MKILTATAFLSFVFVLTFPDINTYSNGHRAIEEMKALVQYEPVFGEIERQQLQTVSHQLELTKCQLTQIETLIAYESKPFYKLNEHIKYDDAIKILDYYSKPGN